MAEKFVISSSQFSSNINENQFELSSTAEKKGLLDETDLLDFYDLEKCVECIKDCKSETPKVALQFPDHQLCDAARVGQIIEEKVCCKTYILADTSYGSCCVDEVAAEHVEADLIIHFGPACLSRTERIPVIFMFGKEKIDTDHCCQSFQNCIPEKDCKILMIYDVVYHHAIATIYSRLETQYKSLVLASVNCSEDFIEKTKHVTEDTEENIVEDNTCGCNRNLSKQKFCYKMTEVQNKLNKASLNDESGTNNAYSRFGRTFSLENDCSLEDYSVFYIGKESLTLTNHMMAYNKCQFYSYNPETSMCRKETLNVNRLLMKRYYLIEKAKDAQVVGILIGTLGVASYLSILKRIKKVLRQSGKKFYTFVVGKINPEKLANFMEIDVFVLIACPENSLISSQDFYKPIITPFEIEIACTRAREWTGQYVTDFQELLPGAAHHVQIQNKENKEEVPDISLISGQLRPVYSQQENNNMQSDSLVVRNENTTLSTQHHTSAAEFLAQRSWKGLEVKRGETEVTKAVEGRSGIASAYTHEPAQDK